MKQFFSISSLVALLLVALPCTFAIPPDLQSDKEGFLEISIGYTFSIPLSREHRYSHSFAFDLAYISESLWGGGCTLRVGNQLLELSGNVQRRFINSGNLGVPVFAKIGVISSDPYQVRFGIGLESGLSYYFNRKTEPEDAGPEIQEFTEYSYTFLQTTGALFASFRKNGPPVLIPAAGFNLGFATTPHEGGGTYHSY